MSGSPAAPAARFDESTREGLRPAERPAHSRLAARLSANVVWNLGSDLAARGASLWLAFFCARVLTVPGFGLFAFAQAAGQYAWLPGDAVLNSGYATRELARARHDPRRTAWDFYGARVSAAVALTAVYVAAVLALPLPSEQRGVLLAASLFFVSYALFPDWAARGLQDFRALAAGNLAVAAALVVSTSLVLRSHPGAPLATALWASSFAAGALVLAPLLARSFRLLPVHLAPRGWLRHTRGSTAFSIGVGVNPGAVNMEEEIRRFEWKVEAGAEYAITQPVFDTAQLKRFLKQIEHVKIPIVAGIWPLVSFRNAEFLHNEVPGVEVTPEILERMRIASDKGKEEAREEGIRIARESLLEVRDVIQGVQVSAPFGNVRYALQVFAVLENLAAA